MLLSTLPIFDISDPTPEQAAAIHLLAFALRDLRFAAFAGGAKT